MAEMNIEQARFNMVEQQVRTWDVLDETVLAIMESVPREDFVAEAYHNLAFADIKIPLAGGQLMMPPNVEGRMIQALDVQATDHALEIGTGSGFVTACLSKLAETVTSADINAIFTQAAGEKLAEHGIDNVELETADVLNTNWRDGQRFDVIAVTGSLPAYNDNLAEHLAVGGRMFVITGEDPVMLAQCITRLGESEWQHEDLFETSIPALQNATPPPSFKF